MRKQPRATARIGVGFAKSRVGGVPNVCLYVSDCLRSEFVALRSTQQLEGFQC